MSEKTLWAALKKKGVKGERLEKCNTKGVPDAYIFSPYGERGCFIELKDWSGPKKHPLSVEQLNFLQQSFGVVVIKINKKEIAITVANKALCTGDVGWAERHGDVVKISDINYKDFWGFITYGG